jgi:hypothetical protein
VTPLAVVKDLNKFEDSVSRSQVVLEEEIFKQFSLQ